MFTGPVGLYFLSQIYSIYRFVLFMCFKFGILSKSVVAISFLKTRSG